MKVNGEIKALWGMSMIGVIYAVYMVCTPNPEDGTLMLAVVAPIVAIVTGVATKAVLYRKLKNGG